MNTTEYPFWMKGTLSLIGLTLLVIIMSYGKFILMPLFFAAFISMLLNPIVIVLEEWKLPRSLSIILSLIMVLVIFAGIISMISVQFVDFAERVPEVTQRLKNVTDTGIQFLEKEIGVTPKQQSDYLNQGINRLIDTSGSMATSLVSATTNIFTNLSLIPIFVFFMIYYREMYATFVNMLFEGRSEESKVEGILDNVKDVSQNYLIGMLSVMAILALLNTTGLFLIGMDHPFFFGTFAALLAVIPYIGIIIGALPPLLFALLLGNSLLTPVLVVAVFGTVQFLEGNFITPRIVGSSISINPFIAMIALIIGGEIWGISGMILFIPLIGVLRVIFQEIDGLEPYGYILGGDPEEEETKSANMHPPDEKDKSGEVDDEKKDGGDEEKPESDGDQKNV
jgi:predicted PurR-regulated permease PerM